MNTKMNVNESNNNYYPIKNKNKNVCDVKYDKGYVKI